MRVYKISLKCAVHGNVHIFPYNNTTFQSQEFLAYRRLNMPLDFTSTGTNIYVETAYKISVLMFVL